MSMLLALIMATLSAPAPEPVLKAMESYKNIASYSVTLESRSGSDSETIRYFYKRPGFVRMEFIHPHRGAVLVYNPEKREVRLRPFSFLKAFVLVLRPESRLIRSSRGHRVDRSDIGALLENVMRVRAEGAVKTLGEATIQGKAVLKVSVTGKKGFTSNGVNSYILWLDKMSYLPLKVRALDELGALTEEVGMYDLETGGGFGDGFFELN
ncbi:MAG: outer membrane lipoprotein carrier protein LolA [Thermodesulfobacteriota bacterium]